MPLGARLRALRQSPPAGGATLTQAQVGSALGLTAQQVSNWERGTSLPPLERLDAFALLLSRPQPDGADARLPDQATLLDDERQRHSELRDELRGLRSRLANSTELTSGTPAALGLTPFWQFDDGGPVTIIASTQVPAVMQDISEWYPGHPDYARGLNYADIDAVISIHGELRARNPDSDVRILTSHEIDTAHQRTLSGHVVVIGGATVNRHISWFGEQMTLPVISGIAEDPADRMFCVSATADGPACEFRAEFGEPLSLQRTVDLRTKNGWTTETFSRKPTHPVRRLASDVMLIARQPNPANAATTATVLYGLYAEGTKGAAQAFIDPSVREGNLTYLADRLTASQQFWVLARVGCDPTGTALAPDLTNPDNILRHGFG